MFVCVRSESYSAVNRCWSRPKGRSSCLSRVFTTHTSLIKVGLNGLAARGVVVCALPRDYQACPCPCPCRTAHGRLPVRALIQQAIALGEVEANVSLRIFSPQVTHRPQTCTWMGELVSSNPAEKPVVSDRRGCRAAAVERLPRCP